MEETNNSPTFPTCVGVSQRDPWPGADTGDGWGRRRGRAKPSYLSFIFCPPLSIPSLHSLCLVEVAPPPLSLPSLIKSRLRNK